MIINLMQKQQKLQKSKLFSAVSKISAFYAISAREFVYLCKNFNNEKQRLLIPFANRLATI